MSAEYLDVHRVAWVFVVSYKPIENTSCATSRMTSASEKDEYLLCNLGFCDATNLINLKQVEKSVKQQAADYICGDAMGLVMQYMCYSLPTHPPKWFFTQKKVVRRDGDHFATRIPFDMCCYHIIAVQYKTTDAGLKVCDEKENALDYSLIDVFRRNKYTDIIHHEFRTIMLPADVARASCPLGAPSDDSAVSYCWSPNNALYYRYNDVMGEVYELQASDVIYITPEHPIPDNYVIELILQYTR